jgi:hypothetical protein
MILNYAKERVLHACMHVLRYLGEVLAIRPHDEIWGIHLKLVSASATVLQAREIPHMSNF